MGPVRRTPRRRPVAGTGPPSARSVDESGLVEVPFEGGLRLEGFLAGLADVFVAGSVVSVEHERTLSVESTRQNVPTQADSASAASRNRLSSISGVVG